MLSRSHQSSMSGRSASMRRMRRRSMALRLYCRTNGCTSFLELHPERFAQADDVERSVRDLLVGYRLIPLGARDHSEQWQRTEHWVARASD